MVLHVSSFYNDEDDPTSLYGSDHQYYRDDDTDLAVFDGGMTAKLKEKLDELMDNLIQSEHDYIKSMENILQKIHPVHSGLQMQKKHLCGTLERIYHFHKNCFSLDLELYRHRPLHMGRCILNWKYEFNLYTSHDKNRTRRRIASRQLWDTYANALIQTKEEPDDRLDLMSYAFNPHQRLKELSTFLDDVIVSCHKNDPRKLELLDACMLVKFHSRHRSDMMAKEKITGTDRDLTEQGCLLRQDNFSLQNPVRSLDGLKNPRNNPSVRKLFLFEKCIFVTKSSQKHGSDGKSLTYLYSIPTAGIVGVTESIGGNELKFEILYQTSKGRRFSEAVVLQANSLDVKKSWIYDITRISSKTDHFLDEDDIFRDDTSLSNLDKRYGTSGLRCRSWYLNNHFVRMIEHRKSSDCKDCDMSSNPDFTPVHIGMHSNSSYPVRKRNSKSFTEMGILNDAFDYGSGCYG